MLKHEKVVTFIIQRLQTFSFIFEKKMRLLLQH